MVTRRRGARRKGGKEERGQGGEGPRRKGGKEERGQGGEGARRSRKGKKVRRIGREGEMKVAQR